MKAVVWAFCFAAACVTAFAQCDSDFSPHHGWQDISVETIGGITYLKISYQTSCPWTLGKFPAVVQGTNVLQRLFMFPDPQVGCILVFPPPVYTRHASVVIGRLNPGEYLLQVQSGLIGFLPFTVPEPQPMLSLVSAGSGKIAFRINGTSNVTYRVESSSTLTNWTTMATFDAGQGALTNAPATNMFYRALVSDEMRICL